MKRWIFVGLLLFIPQFIQAAEAPSPTVPTKTIKNECPEVVDIYFGYDKHDLNDSAKKILKGLSATLGKMNAKTDIEGHCDERGTKEYNLALGDRRANSAKQYLISLGVPTEKIETISYGKERPFCTESTEACWAKNRRDHFLIVGGKCPAIPNVAFTTDDHPSAPAETAPKSNTPAPDASKIAAPTPIEPPAGEVPMGQPVGTERVSSDIFEKKAGNIHPFLAVTEYWTDNAFNTHNNKKSDFTTVISPGIYFAFPGMKERIMPMETLDIAPGGLTLTRFAAQYPRVFQTYLYYRADIERYIDSHDLNYTSHTVEGVMQYNMRGGLTLELDDQFVKSRMQRGTGFSFELDKFYANLAAVSAKYQIGERSLVRVDYSNYYLHFIAPENRFRDRDDNTISAYFFYKLWPKTSVFAEYDYVDINYKESVVQGSSEHHVFAGIKWDITDKTKGTIKAGYGIKDLNNSSGGGSHGDVYAEIQIDHKFTPKTTMLVRASRKTEETDVAQGRFIVADTIGTTLLHRFTTKVTGSLDLSYTNEKYQGAVTFGGETKELNDQYVRAVAALQYEFKDWLKFSGGYIFSDRISNISALSYINNTLFLRASAIY